MLSWGTFPARHSVLPPAPTLPQLAIWAGRLDLVRLLIPASLLGGMPLNRCNPLHTAVRCGCEAAAQLLLQAAPELAVARRRGKFATPLCEAAAAGCTAIVRLILEAAPEAATAGSGWLPIHAAAEEGHAAVVQLLLAAAPEAAAAATAEESPKGAPHASTPLHLAAASGDVGTVQLLLASSAPAAALSMNGASCTPAHCALAARHVPALAVLLQVAPAAASIWDAGDQVRVALTGLQLGSEVCWRVLPLRPSVAPPCAISPPNC